MLCDVWCYSECVSHLNVIGRVPVNIIQHQVRSTHQIKPHPTCFGAQQKEEVLRVGTVKTVNQPLSLAGGGVSIKSAEGVAHVYTQVLEQVECLGIVGNYDHPAGTHIHIVSIYALGLFGLNSFLFNRSVNHYPFIIRGRLNVHVSFIYVFITTAC